MLKATAGLAMPTTINWLVAASELVYRESAMKSFLDAMANSRFREQYMDALACICGAGSRGPGHRD